MGLIISLLIWALIGWAAGKIMGSSYAWWLNIIVGIVGGWLGDFLLGGFINLGTVAGISVGGVVTGIIGAVVLIFIIRLIKK